MARSGPKEIVFNYDEIKKLASLGLTDEEIANELGVARRTLTSTPEKKKLYKKAKMQGQAQIKKSLRMQMLKSAKEGNTSAQIFLSKSLGISDDPVAQLLKEEQRKNIKAERELKKIKAEQEHLKLKELQKIIEKTDKDEFDINSFDMISKMMKD